MNPVGECSGLSNADHTDIEGVILAAGFSKRAGVFKPVLDLGGKPILARCIESMCGFCRRILVVGGYRAADIMPIVDSYAGAELVINENYIDGMFASVLKGIENTHSGRFFLTPGDYPLISPRVYEDLLEAAGDIVVPSCEGENGHPVLFNRNPIKEIRGSGCCSLREFIESTGYTKIEVRDRGILLDVDTLEDYEAVRREYMRFKHMR